MNFTYDDNIFSDLYKDAHGFRPSNHEFYTASPAVKQAIWDNLLMDLEVEVAREKRMQSEAVEEYKRLVKKTIAMGAGNIETAVQWLMQSDDVQGDQDYFKYLHNLPYGFNLLEA